MSATHIQETLANIQIEIEMLSGLWSSPASQQRDDPMLAEGDLQDLWDLSDLGMEEPLIFSNAVITRDPQNRRHSIDDQPAHITESGAQMWYHHGELHRDGDKPAFVSKQGSTQKWYQHNRVSREGDKPAIIDRNRLQWQLNGVLHRTTGPACVFPDAEYYYLDGLEMPKEQWMADIRVINDSDDATENLKYL